MTYPPGSGPYGYGPQGPQGPHGPQGPQGSPGPYDPGRAYDSGWGRDPNQPESGWDVQPGGWEAPAWDQQQQQVQPGWEQPGYAGGYPTPPPPKSNTGLILGIVFGVVALLVISAGIVVVATRDSGSETTAAATTTPGLVPATTARTTAQAPTTSASPGVPGTSGKLSYNDYGGPWNFRFGEVELHADWVDGRDHADCSDIEVGGKLTSLGCSYAAEMVYKAEGGALMLTQFILGMSSTQQATAAPDSYTDEDLKLRPGTYIEDFSVGKWKDDAEKEFVVIPTTSTPRSPPTTSSRRRCTWRPRPARSTTWSRG